MFPAASPPPIVWTQAAPTYTRIFSDELSSDIPALQLWIDRERDLSAIGHYGENWDGFGSASPDPRVVGRAITFLRFLRDRDRASPPLRASLSPDGTVALEWLDGERLIRAEIEASTEIEWMIAIPGYPTEFRTELFGDPLESGASQEPAWRPATAEAGALALASAR
jgi:hypothetical protein